MSGEDRPVRRYPGRVVVLSEEQAQIVRAHRVPVEPPPADAARLRAAVLDGRPDDVPMDRE